MKNIEKYNWIIPIVEKHFEAMTSEIKEEAVLPENSIPLRDYFRIGEIEEDLWITLANLIEYIHEEARKNGYIGDMSYGEYSEAILHKVDY